MTTPLQINRYDRLVRRLGNLVGEPSIVTGVLPDVFPTIDMEDLSADGWLLAGWRPAMGFGNVLAAAAQTPTVALENLAGSGVELVVERAIISSPTALRLTWGRQVVGAALLGTNVLTSVVRDFRATGLIPVGIVTEASGIATLVNGTINILASIPFNLENGKFGLAVLPPGQAFTIGTATVQSQVAATIYWRERAILESEEL